MMRKQVADARQQFAHNLSYQLNYEDFFVMYDTVMRYGEDADRGAAGEVLCQMASAIAQHYKMKKRQEGVHMPSFYYIDKDSERRKRG